jgi:carbonic anhydrase
MHRSIQRRMSRTVLSLSSTKGIPPDSGCKNEEVKSFLHQNAVGITMPRPPRGEGVDRLLQYNKKWSETVRAINPDFFPTLAQQQKPQYLWIGCSDSRVPANQVIGLAPGEVFVHRNIANVVARADLNCLSVIQFAVEVLEVEHVIVCGHYGCGGVNAALCGTRLGLVDNWIMHVSDIKKQFWDRLARIEDDCARLSALCELNVIAQLAHVADTHVVRDLWSRSGESKSVELHGWIYGLSDGIVEPLVNVTKNTNIESEVAQKVESVFRKYSR